MTFLKILAALFALLIVTACSNGPAVQAASEPSQSSNLMMCTMDVKQCPNGNSVGRSGPSCEFTCD